MFSRRLRVRSMRGMELLAAKRLNSEYMARPLGTGFCSVTTIQSCRNASNERLPRVRSIGSQ